MTSAEARAEQSRGRDRARERFVIHRECARGDKLESCKCFSTFFPFFPPGNIYMFCLKTNKQKKNNGFKYVKEVYLALVDVWLVVGSAWEL